MDMMPPVRSSSATSPDNASQSLASRLEVVRSYVQKDSESGDENSDESSVASLEGSNEHLPKERAYSVGCKPPMMSAQLHLRAVSGTGRPPQVPVSRTADKSAPDMVSKQRHHDSPSGNAQRRKISVTNRPDLQKQSTRTGSSKSLPAEGKVALDQDTGRVHRGSVEGSMRPRTSTLPWDLLKGVGSECDDPLRPRSSSGGNVASIRDAVRSRIAANRRHTSSYPEPVRHLTLHRELVCPAEGQETGEYVEMHCPTAS